MELWDIKAIAQAVEADAGQALPGLRESLEQAKRGEFGRVHTPEMIEGYKRKTPTPADPDSPHTTAADWHGAAMKQNGVAVGVVSSLPGFDITDYLKTEADMATYLQICNEDAPGDGSEMRAALGNSARARVRWQLPQPPRHSLHRQPLEPLTPALPPQPKLSRMARAWQPGTVHPSPRPHTPCIYPPTHEKTARRRFARAA